MTTKIFLANNFRAQQEALKLLTEALLQREREVEDKNAKRIEDIKLQKTEQKNRLVAKIQRRKIKSITNHLKQILTN